MWGQSQDLRELDIDFAGGLSLIHGEWGMVVELDRSLQTIPFCELDKGDTFALASRLVLN